MHWYSGSRGLDPHEGVTRMLDMDSLIRRLLRSSDPAGSRAGVAPEVLAEEIRKKLEDHAKSSKDTVMGRIGTDFGDGDRATLHIEHQDLRFEITITVFERDSEDDFIVDDDGFLL